MSHQPNNPYQQPAHGQPHDPSSNPYHQNLTANPWEDQPGQAPQQQYQQSQQQYQTQQQTGSGYAPPPGPPPPKRTGSFNEADFVPAGERGQQREAMQQFEMNHHDNPVAAGGGESKADSDVATLQAEFPGLDGSVIAAIYGDSGDMGATREVLQELSASADS